MLILRHLPNVITFFRVICAVLMTVYYYFKLPCYREVLFTLFTSASISDFFDGYLSRKWNAVSKIGKCFDPIADKLILVTALLLLIDLKGINLVIAFIMVLREVVVSGLREFLALSGVELPVSRLSKLKTVFQLTGVAMCFATLSQPALNFLTFFPMSIVTLNIGLFTFITMLTAVILTIVTWVDYTMRTIKYLK